ncbi:hypothetical protein ACFL34_05370 [Candidatus Sumerlaeota bacterium]
MNKRILKKHLRALSCAYTIDIIGDYSHIIVRGFKPPPGYNKKQISIRMTVPKKYPVDVPGLSSNPIHLPTGLLLNGQEPQDYHPYTGPKGWAWWCFERIEWDPCRHDLITIIEVLRATMTDQTQRKIVTKPRAGKEPISWLRKLFFE